MYGFLFCFCALCLNFYPELFTAKLKAKLRDGVRYCSKDADLFMIPLLQEYRINYPSLPLYLRGDSGFASPSLYEALEDNDCKYAIRLKLNQTLLKYAADSSFSKTVPANRLQIHVLAYNLFNWFRRSALAVKMRKQQVDTVRLKHSSFLTNIDNLKGLNE